MEVYYEDPYGDLPIPKNNRIFYKCKEGQFANGLTWHTGVCKKDGSGSFNIKPIEECTKELVKAQHGASTGRDDDGKPVKETIKRTYQPGGKTVKFITLYFAC